MTRLILAKHALPDIYPNVPASQWHLGEAGRDGARKLGEHLRTLGVEQIVSSTEPKALETATITASVLGLPAPRAMEGLREHHRDYEAYLPSYEEFEASAQALFSRPDEIVWGEESACQSLGRFTAAIDSVLADGLLVVAHGTVISLYVEQLCGIDGFEFWKHLGLPSYVIVDTASRSILTSVTAL